MLKLVGVILAVVLLAAPLAVEAQPTGKVPRIGALFVNAREPLIPFIQALEGGFRDRGYLQGRDLTIEYRFAEGRRNELPLSPANWQSSMSTYLW